MVHWPSSFSAPAAAVAVAAGDGVCLAVAEGDGVCPVAEEIIPATRTLQPVRKTVFTILGHETQRQNFAGVPKLEIATDERRPGAQVLASKFREHERGEEAQDGDEPGKVVRFGEGFRNVSRSLRAFSGLIPTSRIP